MRPGFRLIQLTGAKALEFESTNYNTLKFDEAKSIVLDILILLEKHPEISISEIRKQVEESKLGMA